MWIVISIVKPDGRGQRIRALVPGRGVCPNPWRFPVSSSTRLTFTREAQIATAPDPPPPRAPRRDHCPRPAPAILAALTHQPTDLLVDLHHGAVAITRRAPAGANSSSATSISLSSPTASLRTSSTACLPASHRRIRSSATGKPRRPLPHARPQPLRTALTFTPGTRAGETLMPNGEPATITRHSATSTASAETSASIGALAATLLTHPTDHVNQTPHRPEALTRGPGQVSSSRMAPKTCAALEGTRRLAGASGSPQRSACNRSDQERARAL